MKHTDNSKNISEKSKIKETDIYNIILEEHKPLKKLIKTLKDVDKGIEVRMSAYAEFVPMLLAHAKPEEDSLYIYTKREESIKNEAYEGEEEHRLAEQMIKEIEKVDDENIWSAKVNVLAEMVEHHLKEEEEELLPEFKKLTAKEERVYLGELYLKLKKTFIAEQLSAQEAEVQH